MKDFDKDFFDGLIKDSYMLIVWKMEVNVDMNYYQSILL